MNKYKICVYAICKNEEKFVDKWVNSMKEADEIYVLDTGSTDNTVQRLKDLGVHVETKIISPWRFDVARNESLKLVPQDTDIYVCTDLDELFLPGWRKDLEEKWQENTNQAKYQYNWKLDKYGNPLLSFLYDKIHDKNFKWKYPVHEILEYQLKEKRNVVILNNTTLNHYQDKTKNRSSYLPLLELALEENPKDSRSLYLLAREYVVKNRWEDCLKIIEQYFEIFKNDYYVRYATMHRYAGRCYKNLNNYEESKKWYEKAIKIIPKLREGYIELAILEHQNYNYGNTIKLAEKALEITENSLNVINEIFAWDETIYYLLSSSYFNTSRLEKAEEYLNKGLKMNPENKKLLQIKQNIEYVKDLTK